MIKVFSHFIYNNSNAYLVINERDKSCVLIDTAHNSRNINNFIRDNHLNLVLILITHGHIDHFSGLKEILAFNKKAKVVISEESLSILDDPHRNLSNSGLFAGAEYASLLNKKSKNIIVLDKPFVKFDVIGYSFLCMHTPGHTPGSYCYYIREYNCIFTGDVLLAGDIGRVDLPGGNKQEMYQTLTNLYKIFKDNPNLTIYPGHSAASTWSKEMANNVIFIYAVKTLNGLMQQKQLKK